MCERIFSFGVDKYTEARPKDNNAVLKRLEATEELVKTLSHRVDHLESLEKLHLLKINDLEARDQIQQATIDKLEKEVQKQRQLMETMEETQQASIIELETQRQVMESIGENLNNSNGIKSIDGSKLSNPHISTRKSHSISTVKERSTVGIRQAEFEAPIAFYAHIGSHHVVNQIIIYDNVVTNVGNGYNGSLGAFTAPVEGIYVFSSTLVAHGHQNIHTSFYRNSNRISSMFASGVESNTDTSSATIVLQLSKGDVVTVRSNDADVSINGYTYSSFTGFLFK
ncbi:Complement C1q-like protein 3 [Mactra antiquata]